MKFNISFMLETLREAIGAVPITLSLAVVPFLIGGILGFLLALAQLKKVKFFGRFASIYVSLIRGTPQVVLVLLLYNTLPGQLAAVFKEIGSEFNVYKEIPGVAYAYFIFTLTATAFLTEIFRSAIGSVDTGQLEAAYAIGLNPLQAYTRIILPQAVTLAMPNLSNLLIALVKNTSLAFMMTVKDLTQTAKLAAALNYKYAESYVVIFIIYIVICLTLEAISKKIEIKLSF